MEKYQRSVIIEQPKGSTGNAEMLGEATRVLGGLNKFFFERAAEGRAKEGQLAAGRAAEATGGKPEILEDPRSIYEKSYQEAALNAYGQTQQLDIDSNLSRFKHEANNDPLEFNKVASKYVETVLRSTPVALKEGTRMYAQQQISRAREEIAGARLAAERESNRATLNVSLRRADSKIARFSYDGDFEAAAAERQARDAMLTAAVKTGVIDEAEMVTLMDESDMREEKSILVGGLDGAFEQGRGADYVISFMTEPPPGMDPERRDEIGNAMMARLKFLADAADGSFEAEEDGRLALWRESERQGTERLISGELDYAWIQSRLAAGAIDPGVALQLETKMIERREGIPVSDPAVLTAMETTLALRTVEEIIDEPSISWEDKRRLLNDRQEKIEKGPSFYTSPTYDEGVRRIEASFGLKPGIFLSSQKTEALREASNAVSAYTDELIAHAEQHGFVPASVQLEKAQRYIKQAEDSAAMARLRGERSTIELKLANGEVEEDVARQALKEIDEEMKSLREKMSQ